MQSIDCWRPPGSMLACLSKEASLVQPGSGLAADCIATRHCSRFVDRDAANPGPGPPSRLRVSGTGGHFRLCGSRLAAGSIRGSGERRRRGVRANPHGESAGGINRGEPGRPNCRRGVRRRVVESDGGRTLQVNVELPAGDQQFPLRELIPFTQARDGDAELPRDLPQRVASLDSIPDLLVTVRAWSR